MNNQFQTRDIEHSLLEIFLQNYPKQGKVTALFLSDPTDRYIRTNALSYYQAAIDYLENHPKIIKNFETAEISAVKEDFQDAHKKLVYIFNTKKEAFLASPSRRAIEHLHSEISKANPDYKNYTFEPDELDQLLIDRIFSTHFFDLSNSARLQPHILPANHTTVSNRDESESPLLSKAIEKYLKTRHPENGIGKKKTSKSTYDEYVVMLDIFLNLTGDKPTAHLTSNDLRTYREKIDMLPKNAKKMPKTRDLTIEQAIQLAKQDQSIETINPQTKGKHYDKVKGFLIYLFEQQYVQTDYRSILNYSVSTDDIKDKNPFNNTELMQLFSLKNLSSAKVFDVKNYHKFYIPLLSLFTGARVSELSQLYTDDIGSEDNIFFIKIKRDKERRQTLKTSSSERIVPIHPFIIETGFVKTVNAMKQDIARPIFSMLIPNDNDNWGSVVSAWFQSYRKKLAISQTSVNFHSFRKNFSDNLKQNDVSDSMIQELIGHAKNDVLNKSYVQSYNIRKKYEAVLRLNFGIDLSHLTDPKYNQYLK